ncbi:helix-turn-helix domain-containing protein [Lysinibacillus sp. NPDC056220]|uniref:helix-turn-helix domain-containing protein n=1 Tax=Lysinibacillus sp. NPDC056220 TaxID=3398580 RepID=UPI003BF602B1
MKCLINRCYQWVKKFEANGEEALQDKHGRKKEEQELTAEEKFKLEMKRLERENERLREKMPFKKSWKNSKGGIVNKRSFTK